MQLAVLLTFWVINYLLYVEDMATMTKAIATSMTKNISNGWKEFIAMDLRHGVLPWYHWENGSF